MCLWVHVQHLDSDEHLNVLRPRFILPVAKINLQIPTEWICLFLAVELCKSHFMAVTACVSMLLCTNYRNCAPNLYLAALTGGGKVGKKLFVVLKEKLPMSRR